MRTSRSVSIRVPLAHYSRAALLCAVSLCALPQYAHAQQTNSVPVLGDLPVIGRLYQTPPTAKVPVLGDLPIMGRLFTNKVYRVQPAAPAQAKKPGKQAELPLVTVEARNATLGSVIAQLMDQVDISYTLSYHLEKAPVGNLKLLKVPFDVALRAILKNTNGGATFTREDGIIRILSPSMLDAERQVPGAPIPVPTPAEKTATPALPATVTPTEPVATANVEAPDNSLPGADAKFFLDINDGSLYGALKLLFAQAKLNYTLSPALRNYHVTARIRSQGFRTTLEALLKASDHPLTYRVENGMYHIVPK